MYLINNRHIALIVLTVIQERGSPFRTSGPGRRRPRCNPGNQFSPLLRWPVTTHHKVQIADTQQSSVEKLYSDYSYVSLLTQM